MDEIAGSSLIKVLMPSIKCKNTIEELAKAFMNNGLVKSLALQTVGYSKNYSEHNGLKLFDNVRVKAAIAKIQSKTAAKTGYTVEQAQIEYEEARALAMTINQPGAASTAITGKARLFGFDKDGDKPVIAVVNIINYAGAAGVKPPQTIESEPVAPSDGQKE